MQEQTNEDICEKPALPEVIAGHRWYLFVDPSIELAQLDMVANVLHEEYKFLEALLSGEPLPKTQQLEIEVNPYLAAP